MRNRNVVIVGLAAGLLSGIFGVGGGVLIVPHDAGGATAITPKKGFSGISAPHGMRPIMRSLSIATWKMR